MTDRPAPIALFLSSDLLFAGKIQAAAAPLGIQVLQETQPAAIARALKEENVAIVFLDLNAASISVAEMMDLLPEENRPVTVAFGPHVNTKRLEEARQAGCDHVLPRSRFVTELPELLKRSLES